MKYYLPLLVLLVFASACVEVSIEDLLKVNKEVIDFKESYPNASLRVELVNNITAPALFDEIIKACPNVVEKARYWKVYLHDLNTDVSTTIWVKDDGKTVCQKTPEGKVEVVEVEIKEATTTTRFLKGFLDAPTSTTSTTWPVEGGGGGGGGSSPAASGLNLVPSIDEISHNNTHLSVKYSLKNTGTEDITNARIKVNISDSNNLDLYPCGFLFNISAGETHSDTCDFSSVFGYVNGNSYKVTAVADPFKKIDEINENDNVATQDADTSTSQGIDLDPYWGSMSGTLNANTPYVFWSVRNRGLQNSAEFKVLIEYARDDGYVGASCLETISSLASGAVVSGSCNKTIDVTGDYTPKITADSTNQISESNENNNVEPHALTFSIVGSGTATTLAAGATTTTATGVTTTTAAGTTTTISQQATTTTTLYQPPPSSLDYTASITSVSTGSYSISAQYSASASGSDLSTHTVTVLTEYLSGSTVVASCSDTAILTPPYSTGTTCTRGVSGPGTYTAKVTVDSGNQVVESNENNNVASQSVTVPPAGGGFLLNLISGLLNLFGIK